MKTSITFLTVLLLSATSIFSNAQTVEVKSNYYDAYVDQTGKVEPALDMLLISNANPPAINLNSIVMNFKLPAIPAGTELIGASFTATEVRKDKWISFNGDLYGINFRTLDVALASDYFSGAFVAGENVGNGSDWGIMDNFLDNVADPVGNPVANTKTTSEAANTQLINFLKMQYANGATNRYAFLRISMDNLTPTTNWQRYAIASEANATYYPRLTLVFGLPNGISGVKTSKITLFSDKNRKVNVKIEDNLVGSTISVFSATGSKIISESVTSANYISSKSLKPGAYIVKLSNNGIVTSRSILVK